MDFYEDERENEMEREKGIVLQLEQNLAVPIPEEMIKERMELMRFSREEILNDMKISAENCFKNCIRRNVPIDQIPTQILERFDSETEIYR